MLEPSLLVLGNPENRRVKLFEQAAQQLGLSLRLISYLDLLEAKLDLQEALKGITYFRIESPGENFEVSRHLISLGLAEDPSATQHALNLNFEKGLISDLRPWYRGYSKLLSQLEKTLGHFPEISLMNSPAAIRTMFDKLRCQEMLREAGIRVPALWGEVSSYKHLQQIIAENNCPRLFIKARYSSSASGVLAYRKQGHREQLMGHLTLEEHAGQVKLYNSLTWHTYEQPSLIKKIIDRLAQESIYAETWVPKANNASGAYDFRVLVVAGKAYHSVLRESKSPMTNLHLGNRRGDLEAWIAQVGYPKWTEIQTLAIEATQSIPGAFYAGVDVVLDIKHQKCYGLELNAYGDLLPNLYHQGKSTYEIELDCLLHKSPPITT